jgi:23S rRNA pseudouridine1911/1915/1917 synthase
MPARVESLTIEHSLPAERLDRFLARRFPGVSRGAIQRLIEEGCIRVNGRVVKPTHHPRAGERVDIEWPEPRPAAVEPEAMPLEILFEDESLLVLNKPAGVVVHPSAGHAEHTLVNALLHHCAGRLSGIGGVARPGIVHRLDKDTSGCLVVAKDDAAHLALSAQFASRQVEKVYHAVLCGELLRDEGRIQAAIARHPSHRKRMAVVEDLPRARAALTEYRVLERLRGATLVEARLHTGRTHQLRVHFQFLGHPVAGDAVYGRRHTRRLTELTGYEPPRVLLHASRLAFRHPRTGRRVQCEAPWPEDFADAVRFLRLEEGP